MFAPTLTGKRCRRNLGPASVFAFRLVASCLSGDGKLRGPAYVSNSRAAPRTTLII
jgi:hypothetical protein